MCERWHIISETDSDFPDAKQEIYCCINDGVSVSEVRKAVADLKYIEDLLRLHPTWKILWQPMPPLPNPPPLTAVFSGGKEVPHG